MSLRRPPECHERTGNSQLGSDLQRMFSQALKVIFSLSQVPLAVRSNDFAFSMEKTGEDAPLDKGIDTVLAC